MVAREIWCSWLHTSVSGCLDRVISKLAKSSFTGEEFSNKTRLWIQEADKVGEQHGRP